MSGEGVYREPARSDDLDLEAREQAAAVALGLRRQALRARLVVALVIVAVGGGVASGWIATVWQWNRFGAASPFFTGGVGGGVALACVFLGTRLMRRILRQATPGWLDELARTHRLPRERVEQLARDLVALG